MQAQSVQRRPATLHSQAGAFFLLVINEQVEYLLQEQQGSTAPCFEPSSPGSSSLHFRSIVVFFIVILPNLGVFHPQG
jgi:hypothetical protein